MAITHTETITLIEVLKNNSDNIVAKVVVKTSSSDDSDPSKYNNSGKASFNISTTGVTASTAGFVAYENLTEDIVKGWISSDLSSSNVKTINEKVIEKLIAADNSTTEDKAVPW